MSLFSRYPTAEAHPLFRLLDDYNTHSSGSFSSNSAIRAYQPKFDVREHAHTYELEGELPGIEQKDVHIEFADSHTLVIKGRTEREYSSDGADQARGRISGDVTDTGSNESRGHKATVEDEDDGQAKENGHFTLTSDKGKFTISRRDAVEKERAQRPKYWVSERSVGEFHRAFSFPSRVNQDEVKASLKNGILSVVIPKAPSYQAKRINVD